MLKYILVLLLFIGNSYQPSNRSTKNEICKQHYQKKDSERSWKHKNSALIPDRVAYSPKDSAPCKKNYLETQAGMLPVVRCCFRCPRGYVNEFKGNSDNCRRKNREKNKNPNVAKPGIEDPTNDTIITSEVKKNTGEKNQSLPNHENEYPKHQQKSTGNGKDSNDSETAVDDQERPIPHTSTPLRPDQTETEENNNPEAPNFITTTVYTEPPTTTPQAEQNDDDDTSATTKTTMEPTTMETTTSALTTKNNNRKKISQFGIPQHEIIVTVLFWALVVILIILICLAKNGKLDCCLRLIIHFRSFFRRNSY